MFAESVCNKKNFWLKRHNFIAKFWVYGYSCLPPLSLLIEYVLYSVINFYTCKKYVKNTVCLFNALSDIFILAFISLRAWLILWQSTIIYLIYQCYWKVCSQCVLMLFIRGDWMCLNHWTLCIQTPTAVVVVRTPGFDLKVITSDVSKNHLMPLYDLITKLN